jgi:hypothetical protein
MKDNTVLIYAVTLIGITLLSYILWNIDYSEQPIEEPVFINNNFCGPVGFNTSTPLGEKGRGLFKANCVACHSLYKRRTGPALLGSVKKFPSDSIFLNYMRGEKVLDTLAHNSSTRANIFLNLNYEEIRALRAYLDVN